ncbi:GntR family transcriptional regulator [Streptomyces caniscabiei]|uniref:GntR family transcriptional regulator n=1 Tax=Streptomyces caniscabiei TaxID=2746961 RepID=A0A927LE57_9ACTN|nr:GntR family transcriptional regulator [Streptomyces caniscabiei]MBD9727358.1 GntR family transcriptional regulator [Streptomyces caniscabiei]MDX3512759.1 GntR family transcriptional regulator [Streptomyces caniscabiei]MDX3722284.1 GntR family transcriptional regulator [Streptomyces caniscabiei]MDX3733387.1 GntR family transcriptional regulator [Streptomyces caniscabiei]WEO28739.1 GntR family transcriptional regulator [Streptomyces caniscabiei]
MSRSRSESRQEQRSADDGGEVRAESLPPGESPAAPAGGRRLALDVHGRLRAMILTGELPPGSALLQAEMARRLGVSRTPMREAFRLLQEEGLIDARPDQRARVRSVDPEDLDAVYGARIMLETLAVSMTAKSFTAVDAERMSDALKRMKTLTVDDHPDQWHAAHHEFHSIATQAVGPQLQRMIASLGEHSERYIRLAQLGAPASWGKAYAEHEALLEALRLSDPAEAARVVARHLARTALSVLADIAPEYEPAATRTALGLAGNGQS